MQIYLVLSASARVREVIVENEQFRLFLTLAEVRSASVMTYTDAYFTLL